MSSILIIEDEQNINDLIARNLRLVGHACAQAFDGAAGLEIAQTQEHDLILLDVMLPDLNGFDLMERIAVSGTNEQAKTSGTPVIFLTARDALQDRIRGLNLGADDYIVKPFEMLELIARVDAVLRRTKKSASTFAIRDVVVDFTSRTVAKCGSEVAVTPKEFDLLEVLIVNRNIALSRDKLLELAWGYDYLGETRTVDSHIQRLRMKLGLEDVIKTVYKLGYRFEV
jgi:DNA-binding response OmpR family regulator